MVAEMSFLKRAGLRLTVAPVQIDGEVFHEQARELLPDTLLYPLLDSRTIYCALSAVVAQPITLMRAVATIVGKSGSVRAVIKNIACLPKACRLAPELRRRGVTHVHGTWASVPATVAWLMGRLLGIPWSFTAIRWDIDEANLLGPKVLEATFVRVTSEGAKEELLRRSGLAATHCPWIRVITHGVELQSPAVRHAPGEPILRLLSVGFLVPKKGHRFLIEACRLLRERGVHVRCTILGDGPLCDELRQQIAASRLEGVVVICPFLPHAQLMKRMAGGDTDLLVYPSIVAQDGQREGIPVTLIEALALGVPVLSTPTGDIPELLAEIPGALVAPGDAGALADRLGEFDRDRSALDAIVSRGQAVVRNRFDIARNVGQVLRALLETDDLATDAGASQGPGQASPSPEQTSDA